MTVEEIRRDVENFPMGLRVLAVDDDLCCLKLLENLLIKCQYHVTATSEARAALEILRENKDRFDLVISDVHMPDMDGFKLLELVGLEMDLPVIMLSANGDRKLVMKGVTHGACDYLVKPIRIEELRNIWQHVVRRRKFDSKNQKEPSDQVNADHGSPLAGNTDHNEKFNRKRKDEEDDIDENGNECEDPATPKKPRVVWSIELHRKFVGAVNQLGIEKAVPKRILDLMNIDGLSRENVASHLQKYRLYLKRISTAATQQANMASALGVKDSPFMQMGSLDGLGDFRALAGARLANIGLSPYTSCGMLGRLNSPANVSLHNLSPVPLVQSNQAQNLTNSVASLRDMHLVRSPSSQNASLIGIPSSLELDQLQQNTGTTGMPSFNTMDNSRMFRSAIGSSNNLLNGIRNNSVMMHGNTQSTNEMASFNFETFNVGSSNLLDPGRSNDDWPNTIESSKMHPSPLLSTEPFYSQLPINGSRDSISSNGPSYVQNNPIGLSSTMALPSPFEDSREMQVQVGLMGDAQSTNQGPGQGWGVRGQLYAHSSQIPANGILSNSGQSLGHNNEFLNQKIEMDVSGRSNDNERQSRQRCNEDFPLEQSKLQGGFVSHSYDSLDELVNAMIKRELDDTIPNCNYGFDEYSFEADV